MKSVSENLKFTADYVKAFIKWIIFSVLIGIAGGILGSLFHLCIDYGTEMREEKGFLLLLLPIGGLVIAGMYTLFSAKGKLDTNRVIDAVREDGKIPLVMIPLIFISTVITHTFGGSAGREGAALQLGGSIGYNFGKLFRIKKEHIHIVVMTGMSAVFAALFGTPLTAAVFALEVSDVGILHYAGLLPCVISAVTAAEIAKKFGISPVSFSGINFGEPTAELCIKVILLAMLCAVVSILFCKSMKKCEHLMDTHIKNSFVRAFSGGVLVVLLTFAVGSNDYNGAGMNIITSAMEGSVRPEAFLLKILFTAITISAGFKGGEIVPAFFIGSTFGAFAAPVLGIAPGIGAAIGFISLFCSVVNSPIASIFLALEVFGAEGMVFFAIACSVSYLMSGCSGLYHSQKIIYSKTDDEYIG